MWYRNQKDQDFGEGEKNDSKRCNPIDNQTTGKDENALVTVSLTDSESCNTALPYPMSLSLLTSVFSFPYLGLKDRSFPHRRFLGVWGLLFFKFRYEAHFSFMNPPSNIFLLSHVMPFDLWA